MKIEAMITVALAALSVAGVVEFAEASAQLRALGVAASVVASAYAVILWRW